jgi:uncharacterized protein YndB with AHSA1/START domain
MNECFKPTDYAALTIKRVFNAPIERVFAAWSDGKMLAQWFGPEGFHVVEAEVELVVGGKYKIVIQSPNGQKIKHSGQYLEVVSPNKLTFTWVLDDQACGGSENQRADTLVSIKFNTVSNGTEIELSHENLPSKEAFDGHSFGWHSSLDSLAAFI